MWFGTLGATTSAAPTPFAATLSSNISQTMRALSQAKTSVQQSTAITSSAASSARDWMQECFTGNHRTCVTGAPNMTKTFKPTKIALAKAEATIKALQSQLQAELSAYNKLTAGQQLELQATFNDQL